MRLSKISNYIPAGGLYSSHEWYISCAGQLEKILKVRYGKHEVMDFVNPPFFGNQQAYEEWQEKLAQEAKDHIDVLFTVNDESYTRIYKALTDEYNPLWNVDGTETLEYTKENTGTQSNIVGHTGESETETNNTGTQHNVKDNTGTQDNADTTGSTSTDYATTYNSANEQETGKTDTQNRGSLTHTDDLSENSTRTDNLKEVSTRTDDLVDDALRTDDLNEHYIETKTRGGNIGTTKTTELIRDELGLRIDYRFIEIVCNDIIKEICYSA